MGERGRMNVIIAIVIAFTIGFVVHQAEPEIERMYSPKEELFLRKMCEPAGCVTVPAPKFNEIMREAEKCRT
jgi:hypothetical protein